MIVKEYFITRRDGVKLYRTYSDKNKLIRQTETGIEYIEAVDVEDAPYHYEETNEDISADEDDEIL